MKGFRIKSDTEPNKEYFVRLQDNGEWLCNCADFLMRGKKKGSCKHIDKAKRMLKG